MDKQEIVFACVQMNSSSIIEENISCAIKLIRKAKEKGADFICLPEYCFCFPSSAKAIINNSFVHNYNEVTGQICDLAKELGVYISIGSVNIKSEHKKYFNRAIIINPQGEIINYYDKIHLFDARLADNNHYSESTMYNSGDQPKISEIYGVKIGHTTCYDLRFPWLYNKLAQLGAKIIIVSAAFTKVTGDAHWHVLLRARAIENNCFIVAVNQTGEHGNNYTSYGHSMIINPWGTIIVEMDDNIGIIYCGVDALEADKYHQRFNN